MFADTKDSKAYQKVLDFVEEYFRRDEEQIGKIRETVQAPIYFQQPGHSLTIVGLERYKDGNRNLIVFDPGFGPSKALLGLIGKRQLEKRASNRDVERLMRVYRRTSKELKKHDSFEALL